ncbi:MAG: helix-turn-helix transcriptional regulator [Aliidongia sp.]
MFHMTVMQEPPREPADLTPKHVRAARALLAWSQQDLAKQANVAVSTVADFERGHRTPMANNAQAIRGALEKAGVHFLPTGAMIGPHPPRLASPTGAGSPPRWVNADDLATWSHFDRVANLPALLSKLIRATHGAAVDLHFPSDENVLRSGWDGTTRADQASLYVPEGWAAWEIGTKREKIKGKATDDYEKRTAKPGVIVPANSTFIFVTPRHWSEKDEWAEARRKEGVWRNVRVYDGTDLVHWIELHPVVGLWLAKHLGKRPPGTRELDEMWEEWSLATQWPLTPVLVLSDRDQEAADLLRWLRSDPSVHALQAETVEEAVSFFHATLQMLPPDIAAHYRARCLVAETAEAARMIADAAPPLIIVLPDPAPGLAQRIVKKGHYVLLAYDGTPNTAGETHQLGRPSRDGIKHALVKTGIAEARAQALARDCGRSLAILRRLIPAAPGRLPAWAQQPPPRSLLAAMLAGSWDETAPADQAQLARLADCPYDEFARGLTPYFGTFDQPLRKIGPIWRMASVHDAWMLLARYLSPADISQFEAVAIAVLGSADPRYEMEPDERWLADIKRVMPKFSASLRHGIGEVLILLALWGGKVQMVSAASRRADAIVCTLLHGADRQRWWSLSDSFRLLAEASPTAFLDALEHSLDQNDPPVEVLFGTDGAPFFGGEHLSDLLWALESLAWSPDHLPRVSLALARLDTIDPDPDGRFRNRPASSLRQIHILWSPQTHATLDQRLRVLDLIRHDESNAAWKLMLGILPGGYDSFSPAPPARWRDFSTEQPEEVTYALVGKGAQAISERLREDVGTSVARWESLLDRLGNVAPDRMTVIDKLSEVENAIRPPKDRKMLRTTIRNLLHHHRQFRDAGWALPAGELDRLEQIYERLAPADPVERVAWLFETPVRLPHPTPEGWQTDQLEIDAERRKAIKAVFAERGLDGVFALARALPDAGDVGKALAEAGLDDADIEAALQRSLIGDNPRDREVAHGVIIILFHKRNGPWAAALIQKAQQGQWGDEALLTILCALPQRRGTWDVARSLGTSLERDYWTRAPIYWPDGDSADLEFAAYKLIEVGRARHVLPWASRDSSKTLPTAALVRLLEEAIRQPVSEAVGSNDPVMFQHYVTQILTRLDTAPDVSEATLTALEWSYLRVLEYSQRPAKALLKALATQPSLFIQMLQAIDKPNEDSDVIEDPPENLAQRQVVAKQAYHLLRIWNRVPGTGEDGTIDADALKSWIDEARAGAKAIGRAEGADFCIGNVLSAAPVGADGIWPAEAVRSAIDRTKSDDLESGFVIGRRNRRGVTTRMYGDGGDLERDEAKRYRDWAAALAYEYMRTAKALNTLAGSYEDDARRQDDHAERLDWD